MVDEVKEDDDNDDMSTTTPFYRERILCSSSVRTLAGSSTHKVLNRFEDTNFNREISEWPEKTTVFCWNCAHPFDSIPVTVPKKFNPTTGQYRVVGRFCRWGCAKRYIIDTHHDFETALRTQWMFNLACRHFGHDGSPIIEAPSRLCLEAFGGWMTIEDYRKPSEVTIRIVEPPLVAFPMYAEQNPLSAEDKLSVATAGLNAVRMPHSERTSTSITGLRRPQQPIKLQSSEKQPCTGGLYAEYVSAKSQNGENVVEREDNAVVVVVAAKKVTTTAGATSKKKGKKRNRSKTTVQKRGGGLERFMKSSTKKKD